MHVAGGIVEVQEADRWHLHLPLGVKHIAFLEVRNQPRDIEEPLDLRLRENLHSASYLGDDCWQRHGMVGLGR